MEGNISLFITTLFQSIILAVITAAILESVNIVRLKRTISEIQIFFISTVSFSPLLISIGLTYFLISYSYTFGVFLIFIGYLFSAYTLFKNIKSMKIH